MPLYTVTIAQAVQCYATVEIEADSPQDLLEKVSQDDLGENVYFDQCRPSWDTVDDVRLVDATTPDGENVDDVEDTYLAAWRAEQEAAKLESAKQEMWDGHFERRAVEYEGLNMPKKAQEMRALKSGAA